MRPVKLPGIHLCWGRPHTPGALCREQLVAWVEVEAAYGVILPGQVAAATKLAVTSTVVLASQAPWTPAVATSACCLQGQGHISKLVHGAICLQQAQLAGPVAEGVAAVLGQARQVRHAAHFNSVVSHVWQLAESLLSTVRMLTCMCVALTGSCLSVKHGKVGWALLTAR